MRERGRCKVSRKRSSGFWSGIWEVGGNGHRASGYGDSIGFSEERDKFSFGHVDFDVLIDYPSKDVICHLGIWIWKSGERSRFEITFESH